MELWNRTVGLQQQDQHSHHAQIPIQNSQSHRKCNLVCNKSYAPHRLQHLLRKMSSMKESINITSHHIKLETQDTTLHFTSNLPLEDKLAAYKFYINIMLLTPITEQARQQEWKTICTIARNNGFR